MKDIMNKIMLMLSLLLVFSACEEEDLVVINESYTTAVSLDNNNIVLEEANEDLHALAVIWDQPDFGFPASAEYNIFFSIPSNPGLVEVVNVGRPDVNEGKMKKDFTTGELNRIMLNLEAEPEVETTMDVSVKIILSKQEGKTSESVALTATAYSGVLDLTTPWGVVGSATPNGWGDGPDTPFYKTAESGVHVAYITMTDGEWKIRRDNDWAVNYGSSDGVNLVEGGDNIPVTAGTYRILFDENNLTYTIESYSWGLVGSATPNGWDGPDFPLSYDSCSDTWRAVVTLVDGEWKIRQNNEWAVNYGDTGLNGMLDAGGDNIPVTAGTYLIIVNFNDLTYTIETTDVWGVVGSGYNDWGGAGPDFPFTPDWCNEGIYIANNVPLLDGEIKFRLNNDWGVNYGDTGLDGILEEGGDNIPSTAGNYNIVLDFTNPSVPTYTITAN